MDGQVFDHFNNPRSSETKMNCFWHVDIITNLESSKLQESPP